MKGKSNSSFNLSNKNQILWIHKQLFWYRKIYRTHSAVGSIINNNNIFILVTRRYK